MWPLTRLLVTFKCSPSPCVHLWRVFVSLGPVRIRADCVGRASHFGAALWNPQQFLCSFIIQGGLEPVWAKKKKKKEERQVKTDQVEPERSKRSKQVRWPGDTNRTSEKCLVEKTGPEQTSIVSSRNSCTHVCSPTGSQGEMQLMGIWKGSSLFYRIRPHSSVKFRPQWNPSLKIN